MGGGAELTTCTDYRVATPGASVAFVQVCIPSDAGQGYPTDHLLGSDGCGPGLGRGGAPGGDCGQEAGAGAAAELPEAGGGGGGLLRPGGPRPRHRGGGGAGGHLLAQR